MGRCRGDACAAPTPWIQGHARRNAPTLSMAIGSFKSAVAREVNLLRDTPVSLVWQRGFYDRVIRDEADLDRVRCYIEESPLRWLGDEENPQRHVPVGRVSDLPLRT